MNEGHGGCDAGRPEGHMRREAGTSANAIEFVKKNDPKYHNRSLASKRDQIGDQILL